MTVYAEKRAGIATGLFVVEVTHNGKRHRDKFETAKLAHKQEKLWKLGVFESIKEEAKPQLGDKQVALEDFRSLGAACWKGQRDEAHSIRRFNHALTLMAEVLKEHKKALRIDLIDKADFTRFKELAEARGLSPATTNRYVRALTRSLGWAHEHDMRGPVPKVSNLDEPEFQAYVLSDEDEKRVRDRLVANGHHDVRIIYDLQLTAGMRIGEIVGCQMPGKLKDPLQSEAIKLHPNAETPHAVITVVPEASKNKQPRDIPVPLEMGVELKALIDAGALPLYRPVYNALVQARLELGLPTEQPTHAHRHTVVTRLLNDVGAPDLVVMKYVGHKNLKTTQKYHSMKTSDKLQTMTRLMARGN